MKKIPLPIIKAFQHDISVYGNHVSFLGKKDGIDYYHFIYP